ncbi:sigma-54 interaction domain-containing protein [Virgibacillus kekensis]|uniref:Sigma-54 interaction domain-containing protein n=1 Tax=Virgibacillus kekensis TaxID=202261 RepID=A0ABV9DH55_9BACI
MEKIFKTVTDTLKEGVMIVDSNLEFIYANKAVNSIGLNNDKVIGKSVFEVFPDLKRENSTFINVFQSKRPVLDEQRTFITYRGEKKTTITSTYPIIDEGTFVGAFETFRDVSTMQNLADDLKNLHIQYRQDINPKPTGVTPVIDTNDFIGESPEILKIKSELDIYAKSPSPILIYGETGTGKEVLVKAIHESFMNGTKLPLITQNCAAIPENLLESYLFGTTKGGFTDATDREGLFELANGGILFLDEINSFPMNLQAKLLRVIQDQKIKRVGDTKEIPINVKLIAATNVAPEELLINNELREDLYYRLSVLNIELPPLRNRRKDIPILINHFIEKFNEQFGKSVTGLTDEAIDKLIGYTWPGNVRELRNVIERLMNKKDTGVIGGQDIQFNNISRGSYVIEKKYAFTPSVELDTTQTFKEKIQDVEKIIIKNELQNTWGNISKAARNLDMPQQTLSNKIKKYGLENYILKIKLLKNE